MLRSLGSGLGLETSAKFLRVSVSVSDNLVLEKKYRFRFRKSLVSEKVSPSVSENLVLENLVLEKEYRFRFRKNLVSEKSLGFVF